MTEREHKLAVLGEIARALNGGDVVWAVGGSLLLYCKGKAGNGLSSGICFTVLPK